MKQCYQKHNAHNKDQQLDRSLCALEMNSFMIAAVNSETCVRRSSATTILNRSESVNIVNLVAYLGTLFFLRCICIKQPSFSSLDSYNVRGFTYKLISKRKDTLHSKLCCVGFFTYCVLCVPWCLTAGVNIRPKFPTLTIWRYAYITDVNTMSSCQMWVRLYKHYATVIIIITPCP